ncbi:MAG TPA: cytochrome c [Stellaceae bacterium]|nr:cytochrome c [Stellaceae bacterium]
MRIRRIVLAVGAVAVLGAAGFVIAAQRPLIPEIDPPAPGTFDRALVETGARLAAIGNCHVCHTAPGGADYAGNRALPTPFGTVFSSNITPAPGSGIGHWSQAAFGRAMREGIGRRGDHLYPAFPYPHFAKLSDADIGALYAFIMTRRPVETVQRPNDLGLPFNQRWLMAVWNLVFFDAAPFRPDPQHDALWNRGAYLVAGLGHCGDCHSPRNALGAETTAEALAGGEAEGWGAPALNAASPAPVPWDAEHLDAYLRRGWDVEHGAAAGPMRPVVDALARADPADVRAIATYLAANEGGASADRQRRASEARARAGKASLPQPAAGEELGAAIFAGACAACHAGGSPMVPPHGIDLALSTAVNEADPGNAIRIVQGGIQPDDERAGPWMPPFAGAFTDAQLASLLGYIRAHYGSGAAWTGLAAKIHDLRQSKGGA